MILDYYHPGDDSIAQKLFKKTSEIVMNYNER